MDRQLDWGEAIRVAYKGYSSGQPGFGWLLYNLVISALEQDYPVPNDILITVLKNRQAIPDFDKLHVLLCVDLKRVAPDHSTFDDNFDDFHFASKKLSLKAACEAYHKDLQSADKSQLTGYEKQLAAIKSEYVYDRIRQLKKDYAGR